MWIDVVEHGNFGRDHPRGHQNGAFGQHGRHGLPNNSDQDLGKFANRHAAGQGYGFKQPRNPGLSNRGLGHLANDLGKHSPMNQLGQGLNEIGKPDPNLGKIGGGLNQGLNLGRNFSPNQGTNNPVMSQGDGKDYGEQPRDDSRLAPGLAKTGSNGDGLADGNKRRAKGSPELPGTKGLRNPFKNTGGVSGAIKNLGGFTQRGYSKMTVKLASSIKKGAGKLHIALSAKAAAGLSHMVMASVLGVALMAGGYAYQNRQRVLDSGDICAVQNDGDQSYEGTTGDNGTGGDWTQKGTAEYKRAKQLWDYSVKLGFTGTQCAAILGNAAHEGGGFHNLSQDQIGGGGGKGIFQFTPGSKYDADPKSDHSWSIKNQLDVFIDLEKAAFSQWYHQTKDSHDIANCTNVFEKLIERGGIPDFDRRDSMAQQAYSMFHGDKVKGKSSKIEKLLGGSDQAAANANAATAESANNAQCDQGSSDDGDTSDIVHTAKLLEGYFTYANSRPVPPNVTKDHSSSVKAHDIGSIDKHGTTDCSGYVWLVCQLAGYNPSWSPQTHAMMEAAHSGKGLKVISQDETKAGDIAVTDGSADDHTVILLEKYHGGSTKIVNEGGSSNGPVHEETIATAYGSYWNHYHFLRPEKE